jgi:hypothetical protein
MQGRKIAAPARLPAKAIKVQFLTFQLDARAHSSHASTVRPRRAAVSIPLIGAQRGTAVPASPAKTCRQRDNVTMVTKRLILG